jgi:hypothetical protein
MLSVLDYFITLDGCYVRCLSLITINHGSDSGIISSIMTPEAPQALR